MKMSTPLSSRMRPSSISEIVGQKHILGEGKVLSKMIEKKSISSIIFYGPPGVGKTSIASAISKDLGLNLKLFNASVETKEKLKQILSTASLMFPVVLFIDEIHRLNKQNQDYLLVKIEKGFVKLIGATTENPYVSLNPALRSRSQIFELKRIAKEEIEEKLKSTIEDPRGYKNKNLEIENGVFSHIASFSNGDLRTALNALEVTIEISEEINGVIQVKEEKAKEVLQTHNIEGDSSGNDHYNLLSAFQKSIRGSDTDASLHYLARLIKIGDLKSISRRLTIIAYEDIGLANPEVVAETLSAIESAEKVGFPEARIILSYIVIRLSLSPKSNVAYKAIRYALAELESGRPTEIPKSLHDTHYKNSDKLGSGEGYKYSHDYPYSLVKQQFLPDEFKDDKYLLFRDEKELPKVQTTYQKINSIIKGE